MALAGICLMICLMSASVMAVPGVINYQGKLTTPSDNVSGLYSVVFLLYDAETGGRILWYEMQQVNVDAGMFSVQLGKIEPFPAGLFENDNLYLDMVILGGPNASEIVTSRQRIASAAYAISADHAATAANADHALTADSATNAARADTAAIADTATNAGHAATADTATNAANWTGSGGGTQTAPKVEWASNAINASNASNANNAINATNASLAARAGDSDTVDGKHASEFLNISSNTQTKAGGLNVNGKVGIGTPSPAFNLDVNGIINATEVYKNGAPLAQSNPGPLPAAYWPDFDAAAPFLLKNALWVGWDSSVKAWKYCKESDNDRGMTDPGNPTG